MQLALATWQEVEDHLRTHTGVIIPIGSVEQHGPNGLIGTDHLDAEFVAKGVGDAIGAAVAPTLAYGMSQHHLGFAGSATLRPSTLMLVVRDVVESFAIHGFRKFFFINGHGGNVATVTAAFDEIYAARSLRQAEGALQCRMTFWSGGPRSKAVADELYAGVNGSHGLARQVVELQRLLHVSRLSTNAQVGVQHHLVQHRQVELAQRLSHASSAAERDSGRPTGPGPATHTPKTVRYPMKASPSGDQT